MRQTGGGMIDPRRAGVIAGRYQELQGLRLVPAGILLLAFFVWTMVFPVTLQEMRRTGPPPAWGLFVLVVGLIVGVLLIRWIGAWYDRHYGHVEFTPRQRRMFSVVGGAGAAAYLVPFEIELVTMNFGVVLPVNLILLGVSAALVAYWVYLGRSMHHYLVMAAIGLALTAVSVAGVPPFGFVWHVRETLLFAGVATIAGGLIDHLILTRALSGRSAVEVDS